MDVSLTDDPLGVVFVKREGVPAGQGASAHLEKEWKALIAGIVDFLGTFAAGNHAAGHMASGMLLWGAH